MYSARAAAWYSWWWMSVGADLSSMSWVWSVVHKVGHVMVYLVPLLPA